MKTRVSFLILALIAILGSLAQALAGDFPTTLNGYTPAAWWKFDEMTASPAPNIAVNSSPLGAVGNGYLVGGPTQGEPGVVGTCYRFVNTGAPTGTGTVNTKVDINWTPGINPSAPFTFDFWAKPNSLFLDTANTGVCPVSNMNPYWFAANRSGWLIYLNNATWQMRIGGENSYSGTISGGTATVGTWQHIAGSYDGAVERLYVNGVQVASLSLSAAAIANFKVNLYGPMRIGGAPFTGTSPAGTDFFTGNRGWDGWVDEVAVYPTALSASQIYAHYAAANPGSPTNNSPAGYGAQILADGAVGYWRLDEPIYTAPAASSLVTAVNSATSGTTDDGTNWFGVVSAQAGPGYSGTGGASDKSSLFNGVTGNLQLNNPPDSTLSAYTGPLTLLAWIKPSVNGFRRDILVHGNDSNASSTDGDAETFLRIEDYFTLFGSGSPYTSYYAFGDTPDGNGYYFALAPMPAGDLGNWVLLTGVYNGTDWRLYRNGLLMATFNNSHAPSAIAERWSVGARSDPVDSAGINFGGNISDAAILTNALSAAQVLALYQSANVPPHFTRAITPPSAPVYEGSTLSFNVWAEGNPVLAHRWYKGPTDLGVTTTNITIGPLTAADSATYSCVVTNPYGAVTSSVAITVLTSKPIITKQPTSITRFATAPISFSVTAIGSTPITYQWRTNGTPISGANSATYSSVAGTVSWSYDCVLTNIYGGVTSSPATLTVVPLPTGYGSNIVYDLPIAYYRLDEASGTVAHDYVGGNDGVYTACVLNQPGYSALDPDKAINVTGASNSYVGSINGAITFEGGTSSFSLEMWVNGPGGQPDGSTLIVKGTGASGGAANEQFDIDLAQGSYEFFVRDPGGNATIIPATGVGPDGNWHYLVATYDAVGSNMVFYVDGNVVGSAHTPARGLRINSSVIALGSKRSGVNPDYDQGYGGTLDEVAIYNYPLTLAQILNHYGAAYGPSTKPFITAQPAGVTNYVGYGLSLRVGAGGTVPLSYQWRHNGMDVPGATSNSFVILDSAPPIYGPGIGSGDAGDYVVVITNPVPGAITSAVAHVTVLGVPTTPPPICGLVMHLPMDGNLNDVTGRGNNGSGVGGPTFGMPGQVGTSYLNYVTDTNAGQYAYVDLGAPADLQFSSNVNFSVAYWIQIPFLYQGGDLPFIANATNSTFNFGFVATTTYGTFATPAPTTAHDGGWEFSVQDAAGNGVGIRGDDHSLDDGLWHHLVHVIDRKNGSTTYLDGRVAHSVVDGGTSVQAVGNLDSAAHWHIGQDASGLYGSGGAGSVSELIDDVGIFRRALTAFDVAAMYLAVVSNSPAISYTGAPIPPLSIQSLPGSRVQITWPCGGLQSAPAPNGPWTNVPQATSPWTTSNAAPAVLFYRAKL